MFSSSFSTSISTVSISTSIFTLSISTSRSLQQALIVCNSWNFFVPSKRLKSWSTWKRFKQLLLKVVLFLQLLLQALWGSFSFLLASFHFFAWFSSIFSFLRLAFSEKLFLSRFWFVFFWMFPSCWAEFVKLLFLSYHHQRSCFLTMNHRSKFTF